MLGPPPSSIASATMLRSRLLEVFSRSGSSSSGYRLFRGFKCRGYARETHYKDRSQLNHVPENNDSSQSQSWAKYAIPAAMLVFAGAATFIHYNDEKRASVKGSHESAVFERRNINKPAIGGPFRLYNTENQLVTDSDLRGNWILMYFGYTSSPDVGPEEVQKMAKVIDILEMKHNLNIVPVFVTIDPQRDSSEQLRAYLREFHSKIVGLTGPIDAARQVAQEYRVYFKKIDEEGQDYLVETSHTTYVLDPNMEIVKCFGTQYDPEQLAESIAQEVNRASK